MFRILARVGGRRVRYCGILWKSCCGAAQLAGRRYLPGSNSANFPQYLSEPREDLPLMINCQYLSKFSHDFMKPMIQMLEKFGSVLLRNLPLKDKDAFQDFVQCTGLKTLPYLGGSGVREYVTKDVVTASDEPGEFCIEPHNEMSYLPNFPHLLFMFCEEAATHGGESGITRNSDILRDLDPKIVAKFNDLGIVYHRFLHDKKSSTYSSWQQSMRTESHAEAENYLRNSKHNFKWNTDGSLSFWTTRPAFSRHFMTGEMIWFNQIHSQHASYFKAHPYFINKKLLDDQYPYHTYYGDGSEIEPEVLSHIREVTWRNTVGLQLQKGDVLLFDNMLAQHSRLGFNGNRRILLTLAMVK